MKNIWFSFAVLCSISFNVYGQQLTKDAITSAVLAAPEGKREEATVLGFDSKEKVILLRQGTNEFICLADDPSRKGFSVSCYHKDLEPFMARGRELREEGKNMQEIYEIRGKEVKEGTLKIPDKATLHILSGDSFDAQTQQVVNAFMRWVVYLPYATSESTGLPDTPSAPGVPWLMDAGTHRAHIMITPAR